MYICNYQMEYTTPQVGVANHVCMFKNIPQCISKEVSYIPVAPTYIPVLHIKYTKQGYIIPLLI